MLPRERVVGNPSRRVRVVAKAVARALRAVMEKEKAKAKAAAKKICFKWRDGQTCSMGDKCGFRHHLIDGQTRNV